MSNKSMKTESPFWNKPSKTKPLNGGSVVQLFTNVNMVKGHNGLAILCKEYGINVNDLIPGQFVLFTNRARNKLKVYAANNVMAYLQLPTRAENALTIESLALITLAFKGTNSANDITGSGILAGAQIKKLARRILVRPTKEERLAAAG